MEIVKYARIVLTNFTLTYRLKYMSNRPDSFCVSVLGILEIGEWMLGPVDTTTHLSTPGAKVAFEKIVKNHNVRQDTNSSHNVI